VRPTELVEAEKSSAATHPEKLRAALAASKRERGKILMPRILPPA